MGRSALRSGSWLALFTLVAWDARACAGSAPPTPVSPCSSIDSALPAGATADALGSGGVYRVTLVAKSGARTGQSTTGILRLARFQGPGRPSVAGTGGGGITRYPLHGSAEIALDSIGAVAPGDIRSTDESRPGVLVIEWPRDASSGAREITLRFGADANRGDVAPSPIEGTYMALHVRAFSASGFAGQWGSGSDASGFFCASL